MGAEATADAADTTAMTVMLSGTVGSTALSTNQGALEGVKVSVIGQPSLQAITDVDGNFAIEYVPAGQVLFLAAEGSAEYFGTVVGVDVRYSDVTDIAIGQLSMLQIEMQLEALRQSDPNVAFDPELGHIGAIANAGGLGATASLSPLPPDSIAYALGENAAPGLGSTQFGYWLFPLVAFLNLPPQSSGEYTLSAEHPMKACAVAFTNPPTVSRHLTVVSVDCG
jgi:hypothetical protein